MRVFLRALPYWGLFGLALLASATLIVRLITLLTDAYEAAALTRGVLAAGLVLALAVFSLLLTAIWALASRPRPPATRPYLDPIFA